MSDAQKNTERRAPLAIIAKELGFEEGPTGIFQHRALNCGFDILRIGSAIEITSLIYDIGRKDERKYPQTRAAEPTAKTEEDPKAPLRGVLETLGFEKPAHKADTYQHDMLGIEIDLYHVRNGGDIVRIIHAYGEAAGKRKRNAEIRRVLAL